MATKKSTPTKKTTRTTKAPTKRKSTPKKKQVQMRSFMLSKSDRPFMSTNPSMQTLYWVILGIVVIAFTVWILKLQSDIQAIYDSIDYNQSTIIDTPIKK